MNVLMVAPEPIFEPRGTPLSVVGRLKALSDLGHSVDLATYSMGEDVVFSGLKILRTIRIPGIRKVKIGPSLAKIPLDILLVMKTVVRLLKKPYDLIHTHEEAGFWGVVLARIFRVPHIYDMHSSLPQQLKNFQFSDSKILIKIFDRLERWVIKHADCIITICPELHDHVDRMFSEKGSILIENVVDYGMIFGEKDLSSEIRKDLNLEGKTVALYTGTFEPYQGIELLISSASKVVSKVKSTLFVIVGGHSDQVAFYQEKVRKCGLENHFVFTGQVAPTEVNSYIRCADVLLSPRISGTNTPLKIYGYLRSGVPIVATRLPTHTQVLDDDVAVLTEPTAEGFAQGIISVITDGNLSSRIGSHGAHLANGRYTYSIYLDKFRKAVQQAMTKEV